MTTDASGPSGRLLDDRYRLGDQLGSGGVAEVYRAFDERLGREVAVKLFRGDVAEELHRHEDEMRTLARLDHGALVTVFDAGNDDLTGQPFLVMQLVEGATLSELLRNGPLTPERTAAVGASLADALAYVHGQGLVHRDVKPANVLVAHDGRVHLADFGISRLVDSAHVTRTGDVLGTPAYFAPEQVAGEPVGPPADVYALGLVLIECLTGKRVYEGTPLETAMARLSVQPEIPASLPSAWRELLGGMTARQPGSRVSAPQAAAALHMLAIGDERTVALGAPIAPTTAMAAPTSVLPTVTRSATVEPTASPYPPEQRSGRRVAAIVIGLLLVAAVAVAAVVGLSRHHTTTAKDCFTKSPTLHPQRVENDMRALERLSCR